MTSTEIETLAKLFLNQEFLAYRISAIFESRISVLLRFIRFFLQLLSLGASVTTTWTKQKQQVSA